MSVDIQPVEWIVGDPLDEAHLIIRKCFGDWLPKQPLWKVREAYGSFVLNKERTWEPEPSPSNRDDSYYQRCRFDSFEEARDAAMMALEVEVKHA